MRISNKLGKPISFNKTTLKNIKQVPGVYLFSDKKGQVIYVGKANKLKNRLSSYLGKDLDVKTKRLVEETRGVSTILVTSELEALLLEAKLIRKYNPKFNIELKDDKHPLYIVITNDGYPRVTTARRIDTKHSKAYYGPFPSSTQVKTILALLRKAIPYADHKIQKRKCIYSHIGLCNPCPSEIERLTNRNLKLKLKKEYLGNIRLIKGILDGRVGKIKKQLARQMQLASKNRQYEKAYEYKVKLDSLEYITQRIIPPIKYIENPKYVRRIKKDETEDLLKLIRECGIQIKTLKRVECFDIAHIAGAFPTASMVTFIKGEAEKKYYRHFRIRQSKTQSDTDSLREAISRRAKHFEDWGKPDLIIVDGGAGQVSTFLKVLGNKVPVVGIAKRYETLIVPKKAGGYQRKRIGRRPALYLVQRLRDEAHRFARRYHHMLLKKNLLK